VKALPLKGMQVFISSDITKDLIGSALYFSLFFPPLYSLPHIAYTLMRDGSHLRALAQLSWAVKEAVIKRLYIICYCVQFPIATDKLGPHSFSLLFWPLYGMLMSLIT
jgi:hypothetical protein